jgi:hypothetical protein
MLVTIPVKKCPLCGQTPKLMPTIIGTIYLVCDGHHETRGVSSEGEAASLWNSDQYDDPAPRPPCPPRPAQLA